MARIIETIDAPIEAVEAFDRLADFTSTVRWDPSIQHARRLDAGPLGEGARFEVRLRLGPRTVPLVYTVTTYERPAVLVLTTLGRAHRGIDDVRFEPTASGCRVTWDATFELRGPIGRLLDPALGVGFRRTGAAAVAGLRDELHRPAPAAGPG